MSDESPKDGALLRTIPQLAFPEIGSHSISLNKSLKREKQNLNVSVESLISELASL
jgi:hypothetical protein